jgi:hypothetical protein
MSVDQVLCVIIFPCLGWLLLNDKKVEKRLTRIETKLNIIFSGRQSTDEEKQKFHDNEH